MAVKFKFAMKEQWEKDHGKNWKEKKKALAGFEPTTTGLRVRVLTFWPL